MKKKGKLEKKYIVGLIVFGLLLILVGTFYTSYAYLEPIRSISFSSQQLNYENKEPGSWHLEKSAKWISKEKATITFEVGTVGKNRAQYSDIILVIDNSVSMAGYKQERSKSDAIELVDQMLDGTGNRISLIAFDSIFEVRSNFTSDKETLKSQIESLSFHNRASFYQGLKGVDEILKDYQREENRDCMVLFLTGSYPSLDIPSEVGYFSYLKEEYPYITINAIQYGMGPEIISPVKKISDNQYYVDESVKENQLYEASVSTVEYDYFEVIDYIDSNYFEIENESDIRVSQGKITYEEENQKVIWSMEHLKTGSTVRMKIDVRLKEEFRNQGGIYPTNREEEVKGELGAYKEEIVSRKTPVLSNQYEVRYNGNEPSGCVVGSVPETKKHYVFDQVYIDTNHPECEGYEFKGWRVVAEGAILSTEEYFIMPETEVELRGEWSKLSIVKSMREEVYVAPEAKLQVADNPDGGGSKFWKYKESITKVIFQDRIQGVNNEKEYYDVSAGNDGGVIARVAANVEDASTYTVYIQGENGIIANENSSYLFSHFRRLESIEGLEHLDTSNVEDMSYLFGWCESLVSLDLKTFNTSKVTTMLNMFRDNLNLTYLDVSSFDTSKVTTMQWMFGGTGNLKELDLSSFNTSQVTDMTAMFAGTGILSLDLSHFDTRNVNTMRVMFSNANYIESLNVDNFNTEKVTNLSNMFNNCYKLKALNLSSFRTTNVTTITGMFQGCQELEVLNLSNWDNPKITAMNQLFYNCKKLRELTLSNFSTSNVTNMASMFYGCNALTSLDLSSFDTSKVTDMSHMFYECSVLTSLDLSNFNTTKVTSMTSMFQKCCMLASLDLSNFNTSSVEDMQYMFNNAEAVPSLDLSSFDTSNVTNMKWMFAHCYSLKTVDVSSFNTSKVTNMEAMFDVCNVLESVDASSFDTSNVTNMLYMFAWCPEIKSINLANFNTSKVTTMGFMFAGCLTLESIDTSGFDTSNVKDMQYMFDSCHYLTTIDVSNFNTSKVTNMSYMFDKCQRLTSLDVGNFNTINVTDMKSMFFECGNLKSLDVSSFNTSNVVTMEKMFQSCWNLTSLDISHFNISKVTNMAYMIGNCSKLVDLKMFSINTTLSLNLKGMFGNCQKLVTTITISNPNITAYTDIFSATSIASGSRVTINYTSTTSNLVDQMIATKSNESNIVKGTLIAG